MRGTGRSEEEEVEEEGEEKHQQQQLEGNSSYLFVCCGYWWCLGIDVHRTFTSHIPRHHSRHSHRHVILSSCRPICQSRAILEHSPRAQVAVVT